VKPGKVRPLAICVFQHNNRIFVSEGYDEVKRETFYRPLGGRIEFGEYSHQTIVRELREEIGAEVANLRYLGTLENIFTYNGKPGHEIVLVYDGEFVDNSLYEREVVMGNEADEDTFGAMKVVWRSRDFFRRGAAPLYPTGLLELLVKV
jgi:8-oxo-dGTP pyrophosphatase MutT (NUDIX family)